jgi:Protein of unknown function (DUF3237)
MKKIIALAYLVFSTCFYSTAFSQEIAPKTEHLMSLDIKFNAPIVIDKGMRIAVVTGGTVSGPNIKGTIQQPSADWVQVLPSGVTRMDVRLLIKTDDGEFIYVSYNGAIKYSEESLVKLRKGEEISPDDGLYAFASPTFRTSSKKYDYLNGIQAVNRYKVFRFGPDGGYASFDVFAMK